MNSLPQTPGSDTDVHLVTSHTLRLDTSSCDDIVTEKRIYDPLLEQVKKFWEREAIGVSTQEETVDEKFLDTIHLNKGRYEVSLPWKEQHTLLQDSYAQAVSCLASVLKLLRENLGVLPFCQRNNQKPRDQV